MIPSIDDRLDSVMRALREVILPAIPADRSLAVEQTHLALAQIGVVREQMDHALDHERREADDMIVLGRALADAAEGGDCTVASAATLRSSIEDAGRNDARGHRATTMAVGAAVEQLIDASAIDGGAVFKAKSIDIVLNAGRQTALQERRLNRSCGFEADGELR